MIKPYLSVMINHQKTQFWEWKIQLTMAINFISLKKLVLCIQGVIT